MEKLLAPSVLQTMAAEEGSQQGRRRRCMSGHSSEAAEGLFVLQKGKEEVFSLGRCSPFPRSGDVNWPCPLHSEDKDRLYFICDI